MLRALGLGDFLTGVPAYRALARAFPEHLRVLAAPIEFAPLARMSGAIDEVVQAAPLEPLSAELGRPDVAVNLHGCGPQSHRVLLESEPKATIAFACPGVFEGESLPQWDWDEHEIERWCRLLEGYGIACDADDLDLAPTAEGNGRYIVLHAGAGAESRRWPLDRWIALARTLARRGIEVRLTGSPAEFRRARAIARGAELPMASIIAGKTTLEELVGVIASARAVVCGDTGVAHLAAALRTPSVVLFGPMSPRRWGPPAGRARHRAIWRGRSGDPHAPVVDPGLAEIEPREVLEALADVEAA